MSAIEFVIGDITRLNVEAIVFPAHKHLIRGRGLSAQIFDMIGKPMVDTCRQLGECPIGEARITEGFNLSVNYIIHTVTPQWSGGDQWGGIVLKQLRLCYESSLKIASENGVKCLAFASLGTGGNKIPREIASHLALDVLHHHGDGFEKIVVCLRSESSKHIWQEAEKKSLHQVIVVPTDKREYQDAYL